MPALIIPIRVTPKSVNRAHLVRQEEPTQRWAFWLGALCLSLSMWGGIIWGIHRLWAEIGAKLWP